MPYQSGGCGCCSGFEHDGHVCELVICAAEREFVSGEHLLDDLEFFLIARRRRARIEPVEAGFDRRDAAADAHLEPAAAEIVEHRDLFGDADRMIERQQIHERAQPQGRRALRHGGEEDARRGRVAERGAVVFGEVIRVEARSLVRFDQREPVAI